MTSHCGSALIAKRAELAGEVKAFETSLAQARANLVHFDAVIRLLAPDAVPAEIAPNRLVSSSDGVRRGRSATAGSRRAADSGGGDVDARGDEGRHGASRPSDWR